MPSARFFMSFELRIKNEKFRCRSAVRFSLRDPFALLVHRRFACRTSSGHDVAARNDNLLAGDRIMQSRQRSTDTIVRRAGLFFSNFSNRSLSPKATDIIARRASPGFNTQTDPSLKATNKSSEKCCSPSASEISLDAFPTILVGL